MIKGITQAIETETKEQKDGFLSMLLGVLVANLLGNIEAGNWVIKVGDGVHSCSGFLMLPHPFTDFEVQKYYQSEPKFEGVDSQNTLANTLKHETNVDNFDEHKSKGTHCVALYINGNSSVTYFDSFGVKRIR